MNAVSRVSKLNWICFVLYVTRSADQVVSLSLPVKCHISCDSSGDTEHIVLSTSNDHSGGRPDGASFHIQNTCTTNMKPVAYLQLIKFSVDICAA